MTFETVKQVMVDTLNLSEDEIQETSDLVKDLEIDSLDVMELVMALEEEFGIKIPDDQIAELTSVDKIVAYIDANK